MSDARVRRRVHEALERLPTADTWSWLATFLWAGEDLLLGRAFETLGNPHELPSHMLGALFALGTELPAHDPSALARATHALQNLRQQLHDFAIRGVAPRTVDAWTEALAAVDRCGDDACLHALIAGGSDEDAARAASVLGAQGLSELPTPVAHALVRRVAMGEAPGLAAVALARTHGCPPALGGLGTAAAYRSTPGIVDVEALANGMRAQCAP